MKGIRLWIPAASMLAVSFISYIDRNTLALLAPTILAETRLNAEQYGFVISAFSIAYMIGNPLWGRALDRWGLRAGMCLAVAFWTVASGSHALATGFVSLAVARAALGFGEGATFPGGLRAAMQTLPPSKRSRGIAVAYSGGSLGAIVTPLIIAPIALWWGWRAAFVFTGMIGAAWVVVWAFVSRRADVRQRPVLADKPAGDSPGLADPRIWSFAVLYALGALPIAFVIYGAAIYLHQALGADQEKIGKLLWLPPLGWEIGYFVWGWVADRAAARGGSRLNTLRRSMGAAAALGLPLAAIPLLDSIASVMAVYVLAMFSAAGFIILSIGYATDAYSTAHSGLLSGVGAGAWSAAVAAAMPVFGRLFDAAAWPAAFALAAAAPLAGYGFWLWVNRREAALH